MAGGLETDLGIFKVGVPLGPFEFLSNLPDDGVIDAFQLELLCPSLKHHFYPLQHKREYILLNKLDDLRGKEVVGNVRFQAFRVGLVREPGKTAGKGVVKVDQKKQVGEAGDGVEEKDFGCHRVFVLVYRRVVFAPRQVFCQDGEFFRDGPNADGVGQDRGDFEQSGVRARVVFVGVCFDGKHDEVEDKQQKSREGD